MDVLTLVLSTAGDVHKRVQGQSFKDDAGLFEATIGDLSPDYGDGEPLSRPDMPSTKEDQRDDSAEASNRMTHEFNRSSKTAALEGLPNKNTPLTPEISIFEKFSIEANQLLPNLENIHSPIRQSAESREKIAMFRHSLQKNPPISSRDIENAIPESEIGITKNQRVLVDLISRNKIPQEAHIIFEPSNSIKTSASSNYPPIATATNDQFLPSQSIRISQDSMSHLTSVHETHDKKSKNINDPTISKNSQRNASAIGSISLGASRPPVGDTKIRNTPSLTTAKIVPKTPELGLPEVRQQEPLQRQNIGKHKNKNQITLGRPKVPLQKNLKVLPITAHRTNKLIATDAQPVHEYGVAVGRNEQNTPLKDQSTSKSFNATIGRATYASILTPDMQEIETVRKDQVLSSHVNELAGDRALEQIDVDPQARLRTGKLMPSLSYGTQHEDASSRIHVVSDAKGEHSNQTEEIREIVGTKIEMTESKQRHVDIRFFSTRPVVVELMTRFSYEMTSSLSDSGLSDFSSSFHLTQENAFRRGDLPKGSSDDWQDKASPDDLEDEDVLTTRALSIEDADLDIRI